MKDVLPSLNISLLKAERADCHRKWWNFKNIISPFSRIYFVLSGRGFAAHNGRNFILEPGWLFLIPSHTIFDVGTRSRLLQFYVHLKAEFMNGLDVFHYLDCDYKVPIADKAYIMEFPALMEKFNKDPSPRNAIETQGVLRMLVSLFIKDRPPLEDERRLNGLARFKKTLRHIELNIDRRFSLEELAALENLHPTYFSNLFCRHAGLPPLQYVARKKMEKACHLLVNSNLNVGEIAASLGFDDVYYFSRLFKKHTKSPPSLYRKKEKSFLDV